MSTDPRMMSSHGFEGYTAEPHKNKELQELLDHLDQEHDSEDEGMEDYKIGGKRYIIKSTGYHPVHIGEVLL